MPGYILYGLMSGAVLLQALLLVAGQPGRIAAGIATAGIAIGWIFKIATWRHNDSLGDLVSAGSATGLGKGTIRSVEWPHSEENYVMKEMGYRVARKHAIKLRLLVQVLAFAIPLVLVALTFVASPVLAATAAIIAACAQGAGLLVERWLFFAEAKHVVGLYYGR